ncbi:SDR family NAD(P)-dependent oxidoreductase [Aspergillus affinis]|uniref:SDR family NAD(P)-dependent oxidoreductase n=1 Tax=Aspergillus affinis TaxID=1070780 RepID=UPI0022FF1AE2|nr:dehydrogenase with different specificitie [Aspergillus affinis]KAI9046326.1 dehydrogenase with different specificitie [Aspergillus affinis]
MHQIDFDEQSLHGLASKTVIVTGGAGGIGSATARIFNEHGANVVIADVPASQPLAEKLVASLPHPSRAMYVPVDIVDWEQMQDLFKWAVKRFGSIDTVVANAGIMESKSVLELDEIDEKGELMESKEAFEVIDVNVKGTFNTLRLAMHYMKSLPGTSEPKSIIMVSSIAGYCGGADLTAYTTSKHAIIGLLRDAHKAATKNNIRLTAIAPSLTPSRLTAALCEPWKEAGYETSTPQAMGEAIAQCSVDKSILGGSCILVAHKLRRELELTRAGLMGQWMGDDALGLVTGDFEMVSTTFPLPGVTHGKRILASVIESCTQDGPDTKPWISLPVNNDDLSAGFRDISFWQLNNATNHAARWLSQALPATTEPFQCFAYSGPKDL